MIENGSKRLNMLVDDLLIYTKANSKQLKIKVFSINETIEEILQSLDYAIDITKAKISVPDKDLKIRADRTIIKQVVQNLLDNAIKFSSANGNVPEIEITTSEDSDYYYVSVKDNGIGIEEKYMKKIFGKFVQLNPKDKFEGTGLGLSICNEYIKRHKGELTVEKNEGRGITIGFSIYKG